MSNFIDLINYHLSGNEDIPLNIAFINCAESIKNYFDEKGYFPEESIKEVDELPELGESGKVYYNNTDGKYYIYNNNGFSEFGRSDIILVPELPDASEAREGAIYYDTTYGKYYLFDGADFAEISANIIPVRRKTGTSTLDDYGADIQSNCYNIITIPPAASTQARPFVFNFIDVPDSTMAGQYVGRFTALVDDQAISLYTSTPGVSLHWPDDVPDIVEGHTYEFNLLYDTCLLTDITVTSQSEDEPAPVDPTH